MTENGLSKVSPMCLAMLFADAIWVDPSNGKRTILGVFSNILANEFPATHPLMAMHCVLTDGKGRTEITVRLEEEADAGQEGQTEPLLQATAMVDFKDVRMMVELDFVFQGIVFPHAGEYRFQIFGAGLFMMERRLTVVSTAASSEDDQQHSN